MTSTRRIGIVVLSLVLGTLLGAAATSFFVSREMISIRNEMASMRSSTFPVATSGNDLDSRESIIREIKKQLSNDMGLLPVTLMRERKNSFVELYSYDNTGSSSYGTAGYLGHGYFLTVKHAVVAIGQDDLKNPRKVTSIKLSYKNKMLPARVVDSGDSKAEVDPGDWAIIKVDEEIELPSLNINTTFAFEFAEPIFRLGNDYSKGIVVATGYVGQRMADRLITCLTDGHPGVSGGGVLNRSGELVGIPIGRMNNDFRFSFILPLREEMFKKVPHMFKTN